MKRLLILRHATPESKGPDGTDFSRRLIGQGEREAAIQGRFLAEAMMIPDLVVSSTAVRALSTAEILRDAIGNQEGAAMGPILENHALYNAEGGVLLSYIQGLPDDAYTVLLVAHMPGVVELLFMLTPEFSESTLAFQPGTLAGVLFEEVIRWEEVVMESGRLEWLLPPLLHEA